LRFEGNIGVQAGGEGGRARGTADPPALKIM